MCLADPCDSQPVQTTSCTQTVLFLLWLPFPHENKQLRLPLLPWEAHCPLCEFQGAVRCLHMAGKPTLSGLDSEPRAGSPLLLARGAVPRLSCPLEWVLRLQQQGTMGGHHHHHQRLQHQRKHQLQLPLVL